MALRSRLGALALTIIAVAAGAQTTAIGTLTFSRSDVHGDAGARAIVSGDFDLDGALDFATVNAGTNTVDVFMNREFTGGGFSLRRYPVGAGPFDVTVADFNFDSYPDLVVAAADADEVDVLFGGPGGSFQPPIRLAAPGNPRGVGAGYFGFHSDYRSSIVYSSYANGTISFLDYDYNSGAFTNGITLSAGTNPQGIAVGQFKPAGGYQDIVVANAGGSQMTAFYDYGGTFTRAQLAAPSGQRGTHLNVLVAADFDKDGRMDLAAASTADNYVTLWMNSSSGLRWTANFTGSTSSPRGIEAADLNVDGRPELIVANRGSDSVTIFTASASATIFSAPQIVASAAGSRAVAAGDFDGDGRVDLVTGNEYASSATVLWNRTPAGGGPGAKAFTLKALPDVTPDSWVMGGPYAVADFNHNGIPDIVVGDGVVLDTTTPIKIEAGRKSPYVSAAVAGDFNGDGHPDFAQTTSYTVTESPYKTASVLDFLMGDGAGHFTLGASLSVTGPRGMVASDFNGDGHTDVALLDETGAGWGMRVLLGRGDGSFKEFDRLLSPYDYLRGAADIDGDGKVDLVVWNYQTQELGVYLGDGSGGFPGERIATSVGGIYSAQVADLNGDGRADVVAVRNGTLVAWLGRNDGTFSAPLVSDLPEAAFDLVVADLTGDGRPDVLTAEGTLAVGKGDGTFGMNRNIHVSFLEALAADINRDGLPDLFLGTEYYTAMALYNRRAEAANLAPVAKVWPHDMTLPFVDQFTEVGISLDGTKSYDPDLDLLSYVWLEGDRAIGMGRSLSLSLAPGLHVVTLLVRDNAGAESRDTATINIGPFQEIVAYPVHGSVNYGSWTTSDDSTAAGSLALWHPNANAAKLETPLANPVNYVDVSFPVDPTLEYKLWIRLKAQNNNPYNDSVFVQFDGAVDSSGAAAYPIGTTSALAVNLEECSGCGLSGWGWRDEAWGAKGAVGTTTLRFPANGNQLWHVMRIQTREDGVMIDQIVLSAAKYKTTRPGSVKNDATILLRTVPWD